MPWKDVRPMDEKLLFLADYLRGVGSFSLLCERYGISRKTGYKWVERYRADGIDGLAERSRKPHHAGLEIPVAIRQAILELRTGQRDVPEPKKIQALLALRFGPELVPSKGGRPDRTPPATAPGCSFPFPPAQRPLPQ